MISGAFNRIHESLQFYPILIFTVTPWIYDVELYKQSIYSLVIIVLVPNQ